MTPWHLLATRFLGQPKMHLHLKRHFALADWTMLSFNPLKRFTELNGQFLELIVWNVTTQSQPIGKKLGVVVAIRVAPSNATISSGHPHSEPSLLPRRGCIPAALPLKPNNRDLPITAISI
jgi:hypothetical protein